MWGLWWVIIIIVFFLFLCLLLAYGARVYWFSANVAEQAMAFKHAHQTCVQKIHVDMPQPPPYTPGPGPLPPPYATVPRENLPPITYRVPEPSAAPGASAAPAATAPTVTGTGRTEPQSRFVDQYGNVTSASVSGGNWNYWDPYWRPGEERREEHGEHRGEHHGEHHGGNAWSRY